MPACRFSPPPACRTCTEPFGPGARAALREIETLERDGRLAGYRHLPATKADPLSRLGRHEQVAAAYRAALELTDNAAEREFLAERL